MAEKVTPREKRKARIRKKLSGTAERPRLTVYRSLNHIYAQVVDDVAGCTIAFAGTTSKALRDAVKEDDKTAAAKKVGTAIAKAALEKGVDPGRLRSKRFRLPRPGRRGGGGGPRGRPQVLGIAGPRDEWLLPST